MEAAPTIADPQARTVDELLHEATKLRRFMDGLSISPTIAYTRAVVDLARASAARIEALVERIAATSTSAK